MTYHSSIAPQPPGSKIGDLTIGGLVHATPTALYYALSDSTNILAEFAPDGLVVRGPDQILPPVDAGNRAALEQAASDWLEAQARAASAGVTAPIVATFEENSTTYARLDLPPGHFLSTALPQISAQPPESQRAFLVALARKLEAAAAASLHHHAVRAEAVYVADAGLEPIPIGFGERAAADRLGIALAPTNPLPGEAGDVYALSELSYRVVTRHAPATYNQRGEAMDAGHSDPLVAPGEYADTAVHGSVLRAIARGLSLKGKPEGKTLSDWIFTVEGRSRLMSDGGSDQVSAGPVGPASAAPPTAVVGDSGGGSVGPRPQRPMRPVRPVRSTSNAEKNAAQPIKATTVFGIIGAIFAVTALAVFLSQAGFFGGGAKTEETQTASTNQGAGELEQPSGPTPEDERAWVNARTIDTVPSYTAYLNRFPRGYYADEARERLDALDDAAWMAAVEDNTLEAYQAYLTTFPLGLHVPEAQTIIDRITAGLEAQAAADKAAFEDAKSLDTPQAYDGYLGSYPNGQFKQQATALREAALERTRDNQAFAAAQRIGTRAAYQSYVDRFPRGKHVPKALVFIDKRTVRTGDEITDCTQCPTVVVVPSGTFDMGAEDNDRLAKPSEKPRHRVSIERSFAMGKTEVTVGQWKACASAGTCRYDPKQGTNDADPVTFVSFDDAQAYARWLSGLTQQTYRLPSEAQWEYAARAGEAGVYAAGREASACKLGNIAGSETNVPWRSAECGDGVANGVERVGRYLPNAFGLYDMIGNVSEWTRDCASLDYRDAPTNGDANERGLCSSRIARGGSWISGPRDFRLAARMVRNKGDTDDTTGFRVVRLLPQ